MRKFFPLWRKVIDNAFNRCVECFGCDQSEEQDQQEAKVPNRGARERQYRSANRQGQRDVTKRSFLPQPPEAPDGVSCGSKDMGEAGDACGFLAKF